MIILIEIFMWNRMLSAGNEDDFCFECECFQLPLWSRVKTNKIIKIKCLELIVKMREITKKNENESVITFKMLKWDWESESEWVNERERLMEESNDGMRAKGNDCDK